MKRVGIFIGIGLVSGVVLALFLKLLHILTGSKVYYLLFDVSYVPFLQDLGPIWMVESLFHFGTCIISIAILYIVFSVIGLEKNILPYTIVIGIGSAALFFLTIFSEKTPAVNDVTAWAYWVIAHILFTFTAVFLIKKWV